MSRPLEPFAGKREILNEGFRLAQLERTAYLLFPGTHPSEYFKWDPDKAALCTDFIAHMATKKFPGAGALISVDFVRAPKDAKNDRAIPELGKPKKRTVRASSGYPIGFPTLRSGDRVGKKTQSIDVIAVCTDGLLRSVIHREVPIYTDEDLRSKIWWATKSVEPLITELGKTPLTYGYLDEVISHRDGEPPGGDNWNSTPASSSRSTRFFEFPGNGLETVLRNLTSAHSGDA